jgi:hypothetical protein
MIPDPHSLSISLIRAAASLVVAVKTLQDPRVNLTPANGKLFFEVVAHFEHSVFDGATVDYCLRQCRGSFLFLTQQMEQLEVVFRIGSFLFQRQQMEQLGSCVSNG